MREIILINSKQAHNRAEPFALYLSDESGPALGYAYRFETASEAIAHVEPVAQHHGWSLDSFTFVDLA